MNTCSCCETAGQHDARFVAVVAQTQWGAGGTEAAYVNDDGLAIWELHVCQTCLPKARLAYMDDRIRSAKKITIFGACALLAAGACVVVGNLTGAGSALFGHSDSLAEAAIKGPQSFMDAAFLLATGLALVAGILLTPIGGVMALSRWRSRRRMTESDAIPEKWVDKCFVGEANRILTLLRDVRGGKAATGSSFVSLENFPLPDFKKLPQLLEEAHKKAAACGGKIGWRNWKLLGTVGKSRDELVSNLPSDWRLLASADTREEKNIGGPPRVALSIPADSLPGQ